MKKLPISVCMVSGAEAGRIGAALATVSDWCSEIVVVLNHDVKDGTEEIALRHGAKVFREPWQGFVRQKNSVAVKATQPWVLNLDADEHVSPSLRDEIAGVLAQPDSRHAAYSFPRCTWYCGRWIRHGDWYPDRVIRLWRRGAAEWEGIEPHAKLRVTGSIGRLRSDLLHFSNQSIDGQISKIPSYSSDFVQHRLAMGVGVGLFELAVRPPWRFLRAYIFKLGFLDGWQGYYIAGLTAFSTLTRYVKVREARLNQHPPDQIPLPR